MSTGRGHKSLLARSLKKAIKMKGRMVAQWLQPSLKLALGFARTAPAAVTVCNGVIMWPPLLIASVLKSERRNGSSFDVVFALKSVIFLLMYDHNLR